MISRRTFVKGLAAGGVAASVGVWPSSARADQPARRDRTTLSGTEFDLRIGESPVNFTGRTRMAITVNGSLPAPTLRWKEGDTVTMRVANTLRGEDASIHWHGVVLPANMDGVPGLSFHGIHSGETYVYRFTVRQAGTYWYHSHSGFQEQRGLYGPLVIEPRDPEPFAFDREHVVMLTDWTDETAARVFARLKKQSDYYNRRQRTMGDLRSRRSGAGTEERARGSRALGRDADEPDRSRGCLRLHLHVSDERHGARRQLDRALQPRRARAAALRQRIGDVVLRRADSRSRAHRGGVGRSVRAPGHR